MRKFIVIVVVLSFSVVGFGQSDHNDTKKKIQYGFNIGTNYALLRSGEALPEKAVIINGIGAKMGLFMDYSFSQHFLFSPKIEIGLYNSGVEFTNNDNTVTDYAVFPLVMETMAHMIYKVHAAGNTPYLLIGPVLKLPMDNQATSTTDFINRPDLAMDVGIGLEIKMKYFTLAPEIRYSNGFYNVNNNPRLQSLYFHSLAIMMQFKGS
ncbi:MAG: outer membrane beta-barrel protein [Bacteroidales bacterium]|nr:outer membrane beta-barrel protein [Bacteroidales bacterium]